MTRLLYRFENRPHKKWTVYLVDYSTTATEVHSDYFFFLFGFGCCKAFLCNLQQAIDFCAHSVTSDVVEILKMHTYVQGGSPVAVS